MWSGVGIQENTEVDLIESPERLKYIVKNDLSMKEYNCKNRSNEEILSLIVIYEGNEKREEKNE